MTGTTYADFDHIGALVTTAALPVRFTPEA
jgi:hypothetical protein